MHARGGARAGTSFTSLQQDDRRCGATGGCSRRTRACACSCRRLAPASTTTTGTGSSSPRTETPLAEFDAVLMRKDPPFDMEYVYSTYLLELAERRGRARRQPPARDARPQREAGDRASSRSSPRRRWSTRREVAHARLPRRARRRDPEAAATAWAAPRSSACATATRTCNVIIETLTANGTPHDHGAALHPRDPRRRQARAADRRRSRCPTRWRASRRPGETRGNLAAGGTGVARPLTAARPRDRRERSAPVAWHRRAAARRARRDRRLADRGQRHQPHLLPGDRRSRPASTSPA